MCVLGRGRGSARPRTSSVMRKAVNQFYCSSASSGRGGDDGWERVRADNYSRDDKTLKTHPGQEIGHFGAIDTQRS